MDTLLSNGYFTPNLCGMPVSVTGIEEIIQQCLIRLTVRRGSFKYDAALGSRLYTLPKSSPSVLQPLAQDYISEALEDMPNVALREVFCSYNAQDDIMVVNAGLDISGQNYSMEVKI